MLSQAVRLSCPCGTTCKTSGSSWRARRRHSSRLASLCPVVMAAAQKEEVEGAYCMPAFVSIDNKRSKCFSVLEVEVGDYPGLLRVLSWTLNGLDVVAQNAVLRTDEEARTAHNTVWLTDRQGRKLEDDEAELVAERVRDFVMYCSPDESVERRTDFCAGPIHISNGHHAEYTVLTVREPQPTPGFLLEVVSALSGMNICILQGIVQGVSCDEEEDLNQVERQISEQHLDDSPCLYDTDMELAGRTFVFWLRDSEGKKLDYGGMTALVYTLSSVLGYRSHPTVPPDQEMLQSARMAR